jgi:hypothetical protein
MEAHQFPSPCLDNNIPSEADWAGYWAVTHHLQRECDAALAAEGHSPIAHADSSKRGRTSSTLEPPGPPPLPSLPLVSPKSVHAGPATGNAALLEGGAPNPSKRGRPSSTPQPITSLGSPASLSVQAGPATGVVCDCRWGVNAAVPASTHVISCRVHGMNKKRQDAASAAAAYEASGQTETELDLPYAVRRRMLQVELDVLGGRRAQELGLQAEDVSGMMLHASNKVLPAKRDSRRKAAVASGAQAALIEITPRLQQGVARTTQVLGISQGDALRRTLTTTSSEATGAGSYRRRPTMPGTGRTKLPNLKSAATLQSNSDQEALGNGVFPFRTRDIGSSFDVMKTSVCLTTGAGQRASAQKQEGGCATLQCSQRSARECEMKMCRSCCVANAWKLKELGTARLLACPQKSHSVGLELLQVIGTCPNTSDPSSRPCTCTHTFIIPTLGRHSYHAVMQHSYLPHMAFAGLAGYHKASSSGWEYFFNTDQRFVRAGPGEVDEVVMLLSLLWSDGGGKVDAYMAVSQYLLLTDLRSTPSIDRPIFGGTDNDLAVCFPLNRVAFWPQVTCYLSYAIIFSHHFAEIFQDCFAKV